MTGGDAVRDKDRSGVKTQIVGLDINPSGSEVLGTGDAANGLDVDVTRPPADLTTSGTAAVLNGAVTLSSLQGVTTAVAILSGSPVATAVLEASGDGTNWSTLPFMQIDSTVKISPDNTYKTSINANLNPTIAANIAGSQQVRVRLSAYTSGTATISLRATAGIAITPPIATNTDANSWASNTGDGWPLAAAIPYLYNGSTFDRQRGDTTNGAWVNVKTGAVGSNTATGASTPANAFYVGMVGGTSSLAGLSSVVNSGVTGATRANVLGTGLYVDNGTTMDVAKSATSAKNTTGTGLPGVGVLGFDGTNYRAINTDSSGNVSVGMIGATAAVTPLSSVVNSGATGAARSTVLGTAAYVDNGTTMDAAKSIVNATNSTGTGIVAAGVLAQLDDTSPTAITENQFGNLRMTPERGLHASVRPSTNSGYTPGKLISAATTNATNVKASAGTIGYISASNINAAVRYLKIYNKASAPTVGTDVPVHTFLIPGSTTGGGTNIPIPDQGINLATGIAFAITTGVADADTGAVAANDIVINYGWV